MRLSLVPVLLVSFSLPSLATAETIVLYGNDFETPNVPIAVNCGNSLDLTPINTLFGTEQVVFDQQFTVEGVVLDDPGGLYTNPEGLGGQYALGMLSTHQDDRLAMTFDAQGMPFINFGLKISGIDVQGCGGPFGSTTPILRVSVVDAPGGVWSWTDTPLATLDLTGVEPPDAWTFAWAEVSGGLDISAATQNTVTLIFDLTQSGYAVLDDFSVTASTDEGVIDTDLDGVADDDDNCVDVANAEQDDQDEDGIGDVCDPCPLDGDPGDADEDGVCDSDDACIGDDASGDADEDGWCAEDTDGTTLDCDDADAQVHPEADERCNGVDDDCDGEVPADESDGDGDGTPPCDGDCDDDDPAVHPGAEEICNEIDDDCDGVTDPQEDCPPEAEEEEEDAVTEGCDCDCESSVVDGGGTWAALGLLLLTVRRRR